MNSVGSVKIQNGFSFKELNTTSKTSIEKAYQVKLNVHLTGTDTIYFEDMVQIAYLLPVEFVNFY